MGDVVTRILRKSGKPHAPYVLVGDEPFGEDLRTCLGLGETQRQGTEATQREVGLHGTRSGTEGAAYGFQGLKGNVVGSGNKRAEQDVGMTRQQLGGRVQNDIGARLQWALQ